jgi:hypothetical protein
MIETSVAQTIEDRQIEAFVRGADEAMMEARGYGLTTTDRDEVEQDAITNYQS